MAPLGAAGPSSSPPCSPVSRRRRSLTRRCVEALPLPGQHVDDRQQEYRGWDDDTWRRAAERTRGRDLREVEATTDELAAPAYAVLTEAELAELVRQLAPVARAASADIPYPNAMGAPRPWSS